MIALAYLLSVVAALAVLAVALRPRPIPAPAPAPVPPAPGLPPTTAAEIRVILAVAARLAARLDTAA